MTTKSSVAALGVAAAVAVLIEPADGAYPGPNGRIAFAEVGDRGADLYTVRANGTAKRRVTDTASDERDPAYSADGRLIVFAQEVGRRGASEIWTMAAGGGAARRVTRLGGKAIYPDLSPDGSRVVFSGRPRGARTADVYIVRLDGIRLRRLTNARGNDGQPVWSPDGRRIAFVSERTGVAQIFVMEANGSRQTQLTKRRVVHFGVDWSPDGRRLVYDEGNPGEPGSIWVMRSNGTKPRRLTRALSMIRDFGPAWSPDGRQIAFVRLFGTSQDARQDVFVMNAGGSRQHALAPGGKQLIPAWQPLGR
jgi:Tol biopolymer transport system component